MSEMKILPPCLDSSYNLQISTKQVGIDLKRFYLIIIAKGKSEKRERVPLRLSLSLFIVSFPIKKQSLFLQKKALIFCLFDLQELLLYLHFSWFCMHYIQLISLSHFSSGKTCRIPAMVGGPQAAAVVILTLQQSILEGKKLFKKKRQYKKVVSAQQ